MDVESYHLYDSFSWRFSLKALSIVIYPNIAVTINSV